MGSIFKEYDLRGIYGTELTDFHGYALGRAMVTLLKCRKVVVGRDVRVHSNILFAELTRGLTEGGADVLDLGLCSTPESYFGNGSLDADAGIMITASHNSKEYNGFKLSRAGAVPISGATGIRDLERIVDAGAFDPPAARPGIIKKVDVSEGYRKLVHSTANVSRPLHIAADMANAMGIFEARALQGLPLKITPLYDEPDGTFPNHEGNPLDLSTLKDVQALLRQGDFDFGVAFDGDADRVGFLDEKGEIVPMDLITALIARDILLDEKGVVLYDLRSSRVVRESIEEAGGEPRMCRVGHAFIKQQMRDEGAIFAGELSGHYYFRDNYTTESSAMAVVAVANIVASSDRPLSELIRPLRRYVASGEINTRLESRESAGKVMQELRDRYGSQGNLFELDGVSVEFDDWWFNVRCSNTEPLLRLNLEAETAEKMHRHRDDLLALLRR